MQVEGPGWKKDDPLNKSMHVLDPGFLRADDPLWGGFEGRRSRKGGG